MLGHGLIPDRCPASRRGEAPGELVKVIHVLQTREAEGLKGSVSIASMPDAVRSLLPLATEWGIPDDIERSMKAGSASPQELRDLVTQFDNAGEGCLWRAGRVGSRSIRSGYVAITSLTMAVDEAPARHP